MCQRGQTGTGNSVGTHVHERAIGDAIGDDANAPVCDGSDLRLLGFLSGSRLSYPCLRVAL